MVEVTQEDRDAAAKLAEHGISIRLGALDSHPFAQAFAAHRTATLQRVIDLANACVDQGIPLTAMVPMLEDMRCAARKALGEG